MLDSYSYFIVLVFVNIQDCIVFGGRLEFIAMIIYDTILFYSFILRHMPASTGRFQASGLPELEKNEFLKIDFRAPGASFSRSWYS